MAEGIWNKISKWEPRNIVGVGGFPGFLMDAVLGMTGLQPAREREEMTRLAQEKYRQDAEYRTQTRKLGLEKSRQELANTNTAPYVAGQTASNRDAQFYGGPVDVVGPDTGSNYNKEALAQVYDQMPWQNNNHLGGALNDPAADEAYAPTARRGGLLNMVPDPLRAGVAATYGADPKAGIKAGIAATAPPETKFENIGGKPYGVTTAPGATPKIEPLPGVPEPGPDWANATQNGMPGQISSKTGKFDPYARAPAAPPKGAPVILRSPDSKQTRTLRANSDEVDALFAQGWTPVTVSQASAPQDTGQYGPASGVLPRDPGTIFNPGLTGGLRGKGSRALNVISGEFGGQAAPETANAVQQLKEVKDSARNAMVGVMSRYRGTNMTLAQMDNMLPNTTAFGNAPDNLVKIKQGIPMLLGLVERVKSTPVTGARAINDKNDDVAKLRGALSDYIRLAAVAEGNPDPGAIDDPEGYLSGGQGAAQQSQGSNSGPSDAEIEAAMARASRPK